MRREKWPKGTLFETVGVAFLAFSNIDSFLLLNRDIKGANLLVDAHGVVKLADFGLAKHVSSKKFSSSSYFTSLCSVLHIELGSDDML